jgi:hypothetical protein
MISYLLSIGFITKEVLDIYLPKRTYVTLKGAKREF